LNVCEEQYKSSMYIILINTFRFFKYVCKKFCITVLTPKLSPLIDTHTLNKDYPESIRAAALDLRIQKFFFMKTVSILFRPRFQYTTGLTICLLRDIYVDYEPFHFCAYSHCIF